LDIASVLPLPKAIVALQVWEHAYFPDCKYFTIKMEIIMKRVSSFVLVIAVLIMLPCGLFAQQDKETTTTTTTEKPAIEEKHTSTTTTTGKPVIEEKKTTTTTTGKPAIEEKKTTTTTTGKPVIEEKRTSTTTKTTESN
jgi:hypothetical protein